MDRKLLLLVLIGGVLFGCPGAPRHKLYTLPEDVQPPSLLKGAELIYPDEAKRLGLQGRVDLYLLVSETGEVTQVSVVESSGHEMLDEAATEYAKQLLFSPALQAGKPISIWLVWGIDFKLESDKPIFTPNRYVAKVRELYEVSSRVTGAEKERTLAEILDYHEKYVQYLGKTSAPAYNTYLRQLVKPEVYERWIDLWHDWPLRFAGFHDFLLRYPDSDLATQAEARLLALIQDDIGRIKAAAKSRPHIREKEPLFLKAIYAFLSEKFPQALTEEMKLEAEKYIRK